MLAHLLAASILLATRVGLPAETVYDRLGYLSITADAPLLAGHGRMARVEYKAKFSGNVHVWTSIVTPRAHAWSTRSLPPAESSVQAQWSLPRLDLFLRVETADGILVKEDDNSGGDQMPYLRLSVRRDSTYVFLIALPPSVQAAEFQWHAMASPESETTRKADEASRAILDEIRRLRAAGQPSEARTELEGALAQLRNVDGGDHSDVVQAARLRLGQEALYLRALPLAFDAFTIAEAHFARVLPPKHISLQKPRQNIATCLLADGRLDQAQSLLETVERTLLEQLPAATPEVGGVRVMLGRILNERGRFGDARRQFESILADSKGKLSRSSDVALSARQNLSYSLIELRDYAGARPLCEGLLADYASAKRDDSDPQLARVNLAAALKGLGDLEGAKLLLREAIGKLESNVVRTDSQLLRAKLMLAKTKRLLGDTHGARAMFQSIVDDCSGAIPEDEATLDSARYELARVMGDLGEAKQACAMLRGALERLETTEKPDSLILASRRLAVATLLRRLERDEEAQVIVSKILKSCALPGLAGTEYEHAAQALEALSLKDHGDLDAARRLQEAVLVARTAMYPSEHADCQATRVNLIETLVAQSGLAQVGMAIAPPIVTANRDRCRALTLELVRGQLDAARQALLSSPGREAEELCARLDDALDVALSVAHGYGVFAPSPDLAIEAFRLSEMTRGAAFTAARLAHAAAGSPEYARLQAKLVEAAASIAKSGRRVGATDGDLDRAQMRRETLEHDMLERVPKTVSGNRGSIEFDVEKLASRLGPKRVAVAFRRYSDWTWVQGEGDGSKRPDCSPSERMCAFVVHGCLAASPDSDARSPARLAPLTVIDIGEIGEIRKAVRDWRRDVGVSDRDMSVVDHPNDYALKSGLALRALTFDKLLIALKDAERVVVVADDDLHLVPFDALPLSDSEVVGDRWRIETRSTLTELLDDTPPRRSGLLVSIGGPAFDEDPQETPVDVAHEGVEVRPIPARGSQAPASSRTRFENLFAAGDEAKGVAQIYKSAGLGEDPLLRVGRAASASALLELAPRAGYLHVVTHGWAGSELIRSWSDPMPLQRKIALAGGSAPDERDRGLNPMLLCGLAFTGANLGPDSLGIAPGLVTAEELSALDLSACELAVLSACDTSMGERRSGQGVASLQRALQLAGARSVITSLWKVPDEPTEQLMQEFYQQFWIYGKDKHAALWNAKTLLRRGNSAGREPLPTKAWGAWVLTGSPD
jgi:CHAT domain-containing protein/tetratricopeptide (TPR) repeat protein